MNYKQKWWLGLVLLLVSMFPFYIAVSSDISPAMQQDAFIGTFILLAASWVNFAMAGYQARIEDNSH